MSDSDTVFTDAMSARYERLLGPALFAPFAERVCAIVVEHHPAHVLETAAGTGILTRRMADALPAARITAAGFARAAVETVALTARASAADYALGICEGTPLAAELGDSVESAIPAATDALLAELRTGMRDEIEGVDTAHLVVAS